MDRGEPLSQDSNEEFIRAAGGLVWRASEHGRQLLLIHRKRYDDWSLPKGKLEPGESWPDAARREVTEETGYAVSFQEFAGVTTYFDGRRPKVVLFWNMIALGEAGLQTIDDESVAEVDQMMWVDADEAAARLTYADERALVTQNWSQER
jgi:8-oxo-dGTP pyrophosphatase MutT (NUDIX family)